jgi:hypothetical protein
MLEARLRPLLDRQVRDGLWIRLVCDDKLHLTEPAGQAPCPSCGKPFCRACFAAACPRCGWASETPTT